VDDVVIPRFEDEVLAEERHDGRVPSLTRACCQTVGVESRADDDGVEFLSIDRGADKSGVAAAGSALPPDVLDGGRQPDPAAAGADVGDEGLGQSGIVDDCRVGGVQGGHALGMGFDAAQSVAVEHGQAGDAVGLCPFVDGGQAFDLDLVSGDDDLSALVDGDVVLIGEVEQQRDAATAESGLEAAGLVEALEDEAGIVSIDLANGDIQIDLAKIVKGGDASDLNGLDPNPQVMTSDTISQITDALGAISGKVNDTLTDALNDVHLLIELSGLIELLSGTLPGVNGKITVDATLGQLPGTDDTDPDIDTDLSILGVDAGAIINA